MSISSRITEMEQHITNAYDGLEDIGADLTNIDKNINNISTVLDNIWNDLPKVTATDVEEATLNGTKKGRMNIDLKGNTSQETSILPSEYQQVEYIESTGTQYINTGLTSDKTKKLKYETSIMWSNDIQTRQNCGADYGQFFGIRNGIYQVGVENTTIVPSTTTFDKVIAEYDMPNNSGFLNVNGTVFNYTRNSWTNADISIFILKAAGGNLVYPMSCKIKYFKIYEDNTLIANYIPCYRKSDDKIGLYDIVSNTFKTNNRTGTFNKGNDVTLPNPDYPQTIHNVSGNNNIKIENKNLLNLVDASGTTNGINYTVSNQKITLNGTGTSGRYPWLIFTRAGTYTQNGTPSTSSILDKANGTYWSIGQVARLINYISGTATVNFAINLYDETGTQNNTPTSTTKIIAIAIYLGASQTYTNYTFNVQLEYGSTATTYVAHEEQNLPFTFAEGQKAMQGTTLQDDGIHNTWKQYTFTGQETFTDHNNFNDIKGFRFAISDLKVNNGNVKSNNFIGVSITDYNSSNRQYARMSTVESSPTAHNLYITQPNSEIDSTKKLQAFFRNKYNNGTPVTVEYKLATEEIIPYSETQQEQYNAIKKAHSYDDQTNISQTNNDLPFILDITALKK